MFGELSKKTTEKSFALFAHLADSNFCGIIYRVACFIIPLSKFFPTKNEYRSFSRADFCGAAKLSRFVQRPVFFAGHQKYACICHWHSAD